MFWVGGDLRHIRGHLYVPFAFLTLSFHCTYAISRVPYWSLRGRRPDPPPLCQKSPVNWAPCVLMPQDIILWRPFSRATLEAFVVAPIALRHLNIFELRGRSRTARRFTFFWVLHGYAGLTFAGAMWLRLCAPFSLAYWFRGCVWARNLLLVFLSSRTKRRYSYRYSTHPCLLNSPSAFSLLLRAEDGSIIFVVLTSTSGRSQLEV